MSDPDLLGLGLLALAGLGAGMVNTVAGAGSLITLPALIFSGLAADAANATNRIGVLVQNAVAIAAMERGGIKLGRTTVLLCLPAVLGALLGAWLATLLSAAQTQAAIAIAILVMLPLSLWRPRPADVPVPAPVPAPPPAPKEPRPTALLYAAFFFIGIYGGLLQAGIGIVILLWLSLVHRTHLVVANAMKLVLILALTVAALALFSFGGETIDPVRGGVLAGGTAAGALLGARLALRKGEKLIRVCVVVAVLASAAKLVVDLVRAA